MAKHGSLGFAKGWLVLFQFSPVCIAKDGRFVLSALLIRSVCRVHFYSLSCCVVCFFSIYVRFAAWRSGGFLAQKFNRRTALEPTTKLSNEAPHPPFRQTAVMRSLFLSVVILPFSLTVRQVKFYVLSKMF
jgi:hypothetical protein